MFMDWMQEQDPLVEIPNEYVMMARVSVLLRGIASAFGMRLRIAPRWAATAERLLAEHAPDRLTAINQRRAQRAAAAAERTTTQRTEMIMGKQ